ncbi:MAG TPA: hypothetical protein VD789_07210, partial [Thermomicrobiales bacterium]|nr:hypothetical protein [Thermomicrobiales bacterium]
VDVLMESTPAQVDSRAVRQAMTDVDGVVSVHDLHIWTVTSGLIAMSAHVEVSGERDWPDVLVELASLLRERFGIHHVTLQPEDDRADSDFLACSLDSPEGQAACLSQPSSPVPPSAAHHH